MATINREWYIISTGRVACTASAMTPKSVRIPDDADFQLCQILVPFCTSPLFRFQIKKSAGDKYLSNNPIEIMSLLRFNDSTTTNRMYQEPYDIPPEGRVIFPSGTDILFEMTDYSTSTNTIDFVVGGFKLRKVADQQ